MDERKSQFLYISESCYSRYIFSPPICFPAHRFRNFGVQPLFWVWLSCLRTDVDSRLRQSGASFIDVHLYHLMIHNMRMIIGDGAKVIIAASVTYFKKPQRQCEGSLHLRVTGWSISGEKITLFEIAYWSTTLSEALSSCRSIGP